MSPNTTPRRSIVSESTTTEHISSYASLAAIGTLIRERNLFDPVHEQVKVQQKTVKHTPTDKLYDALIAMLAGAHGLVEINTRLRTEPALQRAFGREACAEQSVVQDTLDACTAENVAQLQAALTTIYRTHSLGCAHDYGARHQLLDVDMSGLPCGKQATFGSRGYFAKQRNRRGRQLGRVLATHYQEVVVDQVFDGKTQLTTALQPLVEAAAAVLELDEARRARTIVRVDAGGGSLDDVNWLLAHGFIVLTKDYSSQRSAKLAQSVTRWFVDPKLPEREVGWVMAEASDYVRDVQRIAVRCRKANGQWGYAVLIAPTDLGPVWSVLHPDDAMPADPLDQLLATIYAYDARGGGIETSLKEDKQGLGLTKRQKRRFAAQQMVTLLSSLAHNVLVWTRGWLTASEPKLARYGIKRLVRDIFHINGRVLCNALGHVCEIILNPAAPLVRGLVVALRALLTPLHIVVRLGES
ncbi:MAG: transposase [Chloroflexia bacterium]|nr:transposase [Chloroflexia bacterium]